MGDAFRNKVDKAITRVEDQRTDDLKEKSNNSRNFDLEKKLSKLYGVSYDENETIKESGEQKKEEFVDDPEWIKNNNRKQFLEELQNKVGGNIKATENKIKDLTPLKEGIGTRISQEKEMLNSVEKSMWGLGAFFFYKDIQKRKEKIAELKGKREEYAAELEKAESTLSACKKHSSYLAKQEEVTIKIEIALEEKYLKKAGLENNIDKSVVHRRQGMFRQTEKDPNNIPNNRKHGVINKSNNQHSNQSTISKRNKVGVER